jgi:tetratricopeptide (TPR) repeat protein
MTGALAAVLALAAGASGEEARRPPIDEAKIQAEMDALQDAAAPLPQETAERANKLLREGVKLHDESKLEAALAKYREAIALAPLYAAAYYEMSFSLAELGRNAESLEAITRALALDPKEEQFYVLKGNILDNLGFPEQAKATYRALLEVMPNSYMGLINLGVCHLRTRTRRPRGYCAGPATWRPITPRPTTTWRRRHAHADTTTRSAPCSSSSSSAARRTHAPTARASASRR